MKWQKVNYQKVQEKIDSLTSEEDQKFVSSSSNFWDSENLIIEGNIFKDTRLSAVDKIARLISVDLNSYDFDSVSCVLDEVEVISNTHFTLTHITSYYDKMLQVVIDEMEKEGFELSRAERKYLLTTVEIMTISDKTNLSRNVTKLKTDFDNEELSVYCYIEAFNEILKSDMLDVMKRIARKQLRIVEEIDKEFSPISKVKMFAKDKIEIVVSQYKTDTTFNIIYADLSIDVEEQLRTKLRDITKRQTTILQNDKLGLRDTEGALKAAFAYEVSLLKAVKDAVLEAAEA